MQKLLKNDPTICVYEITVKKNKVINIIIKEDTKSIFDTPASENFSYDQMYRINLSSCQTWNQVLQVQLFPKIKKTFSHLILTIQNIT